MVGLTPPARKVGLLGCSWQALSHCLHQMVGLPPPAKGGLACFLDSTSTGWWACFHLQNLGLLVSWHCQELTGSGVKVDPTAHKCHPTRVKPCRHRVSKAETGRGKLIRHSSKAQKRTQLSLVAFTLKLAQSEGNRPSI